MNGLLKSKMNGVVNTRKKNEWSTATIKVVSRKIQQRYNKNQAHLEKN